jgi:hypothetical protein
LESVLKPFMGTGHACVVCEGAFLKALDKTTTVASLVLATEKSEPLADCTPRRAQTGYHPVTL